MTQIMITKSLWGRR